MTCGAVPTENSVGGLRFAPPRHSAIALTALTVLFAAGLHAAESVPTLVVQREQTPLERRVDGTIEAVNQGTVAAQTSGRVTEVLYDVNDFVPAGAVIVRLRNTEQQAGLEAGSGGAARGHGARDRSAEPVTIASPAMYEDRAVSRQAMLMRLSRTGTPPRRGSPPRAPRSRAREKASATRRFARPTRASSPSVTCRSGRPCGRDRR